MYPFTLGTLEAGSLQHAKEPGHTFLPMYEHLTESKKQHPGTLSFQFFTLWSVCVLYRNKDLSPQPCHRTILCDKAESETPTKWKKGQIPKEKTHGHSHSYGSQSQGTDQSSGRPELGRGGPRDFGSSVRGFGAKNMFWTLQQRPLWHVHTASIMSSLFSHHPSLGTPTHTSHPFINLFPDNF